MRIKFSKYYLIKLSIISFLISFSLIYYIELNYLPKEIGIENISKEMISETYLIQGFIKKDINSQKYNSNKIISFNIFNKDYTLKIKAILFIKNNETNIILKKNIKYKFIGKISLYNNDLEFIIKNIII